jgi:GTP-binding protein
MKVRSVEFVKSAAKREQWPGDGKPCIAFAGRSNVGKSSLINRLVARKNLVRVSRTPGRTQLLNFFLVNDAYYFVDLPGYGYANAPKSVKKQWGPMIREFVENSPTLCAVVQLIDVRHAATAQDEDLLDWLTAGEMPTILVLTKADKLGNNDLAKQKRAIPAQLGLAADAFTVFSAEDGRGSDELWSRLTAALAGAGAA